MTSNFYGWRKSSFSSANNDCVEVGFSDTGGLAVRDTKDPGKGTITLSPQQSVAFTAAVKNDRFTR